MKISKSTIHKLLLLSFTIAVIGYFISTLVIIPFISPDPIIDSFPSSCSHPDNCTRVADKNHRANNITPPLVNANITETLHAIKVWSAHQKILFETDTFVHIRWTMPLTKFRDDVLILLKPENNNTQTVIWIQSQSRIGSYDFNTNTNRVRAFIQFMNSYAF